MNTPELDQLERDGDMIIREFLKGNEAATLFIKRIFSILHIWDDLIDKDKNTTEDEINQCFWMALIDLPTDRFYLHNFTLLNPVLVNAVNNWIAANRLEREGDMNDKTISFILRGSYIDLLSISAFIVGGREWANEAVPAIRRWEHREGLNGYLNGLLKGGK